MLNKELPYGAFMMGFDFHLTESGPRLIEINTNAGGLATVIALSSRSLERKVMQSKFVDVSRGTILTF